MPARKHLLSKSPARLDSAAVARRAMAVLALVPLAWAVFAAVALARADVRAQTSDPATDGVGLGAQSGGMRGASAQVVRPADAFVNSIGVNVHLTYHDTTYRNYDTVVLPRLKELGVRHLRDGVQRDNPAFYDRVRALGELGMRFSLIVPPDVIERPSELTAAVAAVGPALVQLEGPNELDTTGTGWEEKARRLQRELYQVAAGRPEWAHLSVAGPSLANTRDSPAKLGNLSAHLDYGNLHNYPGGTHMGSPYGGGWGISLDRALAEARNVSGKKPLVSTESGYHNNTARGTQPGVSEAAAGKLIPRLLAYQFNRGIVRTYVYELADQRRDAGMTDMENHFGIIRHDGTPKPAFVAIRNLVALLNDSGPPFRATLLDVKVDGDTTDVHQTLLQKRDGRYYLLVWQEVASYDLSANKDLKVEPRPVTVSLGRKFARAAEYRLSADDGSARPVRESRDVAELRLNVPDELLVVELCPAK